MSTVTSTATIPDRNSASYQTTVPSAVVILVVKAFQSRFITLSTFLMPSFPHQMFGVKFPLLLMLAVIYCLTITFVTPVSKKGQRLESSDQPDWISSPPQLTNEMIVNLISGSCEHLVSILPILNNLVHNIHKCDFLKSSFIIEIAFDFSILITLYVTYLVIIFSHKISLTS